MNETQNVYNTLANIIDNARQGSRGYRTQLDPKIWQYYPKERYVPAVFVGWVVDCTIHVLEGSDIVQLDIGELTSYPEYRIPGLAAELTRVKYATLSINEFASEYRVMHQKVIDAIKTYFDFESSLEVPAGFRIWPDEVDDIFDLIKKGN
nr:MAG TPA: hypothetical protein [Caudoviricetes sp.]